MTETEDAPERPDAHLRDLADGCGCAEVWEHTSAARAGDGTGGGDENGSRGVDGVDDASASGTDDD